MKRTKLLEDVLGSDGAAALQKAVDRSPALSDALLPRAALSWARLAVQHGYDGLVPGATTARVLVKSGTWTLSTEDSVVEGQGDAGLAAVLLVMSGTPAVAQTGGAALVKLGKSLDQLAGAVWTRRAAEHLQGIRDRARRPMQKATPKPPGAAGGLAAPGPAAPPFKAEQPAAPEAPTRQQQAPKPPKAPGAKSVNFQRSELQAKCGMCGRAQMSGPILTGCTCFAALMKSTQSVMNRDRVQITFSGDEWDADAILTFCETVRGKHAR